MSALEDIELENVRSILGALFLFSKSVSSEVSFNSLNEAGALEGMMYLERKGYLNVIDGHIKDNPVYQLNDRGWNYLRQILDTAKERIPYPR